MFYGFSISPIVIGLSMYFLIYWWQTSKGLRANWLILLGLVVEHAQVDPK